MHEWPIANNIFYCDFLLQLLLHLVILPFCHGTFYKENTLISPNFFGRRWIFLFFPVLGTQDIKE